LTVQGLPIGFGRVALVTGNLCVLSGELEAGVCVREFSRRLPLRRCVTGSALGRELAAMIVLVTTPAGGFKAKVGSRLYTGGFRQHIFHREPGCIMTALAFKLSMLSFKNKACLPVIEFARVKTDQLEFLAVMFLVAGAAFHISGREMVSAFYVNARFDFGMACQALGAERLVPKVVTLGAIADAFQACMC
jgi:hypothetical protein